MATKKTLLGLPVEMVSQICRSVLPDTLPPHYRTFHERDEGRKAFADLANLVRVCKDLYVIVSPILQKYEGQIGFTLRMFNYVRAILTDPGAAQRHTILTPVFGSIEDGELEIASVETAEEVASKLELDFSSDDLDAVVKLDAGVESDNGDPYELHRARGNLAAIAIANILYLKSISVYSVGYNLRELPGMLELPHVTEAELVTYDSRGDISRFRHCFEAAPALEVLETNGIRMCSQPLVLPRLRILKLFRTRLSWIGVQNLMAHSDKVQEFYYRRDRYMDNEQPGPPVCASDILTALKYTKSLSTIEFLEFDMLEEVHVQGKWIICSPSRPSDFIETLKPMVSLRYLELTQQTLWTHAYDLYRNHCGNGPRLPDLHSPRRLIDLLPDSIEFFEFTEITEEFMPSLIALAEHIREKNAFPNFWSIQLHPSPRFLRKLRHARAHEVDSSLPYEDHKTSPCVVHTELLEQCDETKTIFKEAGVNVLFPFELLQRDDYHRRTDDISHWCTECHMDDASCHVQAMEEV
ncbi:hypothetical protein F4820DRAFT_454154 [Hypoxylon rubiginosum]|uniref:Uncharacterized protein n=1 Tax=Hypoxylon rubiginosum TaxID=110542 RepID=A0ACB9YIX5_9PEZI|nr:hypothetical protein F4820DRAFT_454154 [Hypoxylon rubiginosum]